MFGTWSLLKPTWPEVDAQFLFLWAACVCQSATYNVRRSGPNPQQLMEVYSPPARQSFAADFDQVSSFVRRARFPDKAECCGNRNLKVSGETFVTLSVQIGLNFLYIWHFDTLAFRLYSVVFAFRTVLAFLLFDSVLFPPYVTSGTQRCRCFTLWMSPHIGFKCSLYVFHCWRALPVFV